MNIPKVFQGYKVSLHCEKGTKYVCRQHNNRSDNREHSIQYKETHHPEKAHLNEYIIDYDLKDFFHQELDGAIDDYNAKQTRDDRKKDFETYFKDNKDQVREAVIQIGNEDYQLTDEQYREAYHDCLSYFQQTYPNLKVFGAYIHMDETTPHMHLDFLPVAKRGNMEKAVNTKGAFKAMGFKESGKFEDILFNQFLKKTQDGLEETVRKYCPTLVKAEHCGRGHITTNQFYLSTQESRKEELEKTIAQEQEQKLAMSKKGIFGKVTISQDEYTYLTNADKELKSTHKRIDEKEKELDKKNKQLETATQNMKAIAQVSEHERQKLLDLQKTGAELLDNEQQYINQKANEKASAIVEDKTKELTKVFDSELKKVKDREQIVKDSEKRIRQRDERRQLSSTKVKSIIKQKEGENKNVNRPHQFNR